MSIVISYDPGIRVWGKGGHILALTMVMRTMSHVPWTRSLRDSIMNVEL